MKTSTTPPRAYYVEYDNVVVARPTGVNVLLPPEPYVCVASDDDDVDDVVHDTYVTYDDTFDSYYDH